MNNQEYLKFTSEELVQLIKKRAIPQHAAIIMDGNGRWASKRNLPRTLGHRSGMDALNDVIRTSCEIGIRYLTIYAFSTENWKRPTIEVNTLMSFISEYIDRHINELHTNSIKITILGDLSPLQENLRSKINQAVATTAFNSALQLNIALNYGARTEILQAVKQLVEDVGSNLLDIDDLTESCFAKYLYTASIPDPDFIIRTGGDYRLSNFLLYQAAYSELIFTSPEIMWPDFKKLQYLQTILEFQNRHRRFGDL